MPLTVALKVSATAGLGFMGYSSVTQPSLALFTFLMYL
jgi:hypothetical protein